MKKMFYLAFVLVLATGLGCALTDYRSFTPYNPPTFITDNDQVNQGQQGSGLVNTTGYAHVRESSQVAITTTAGQTEHLWFVDQNSAGDQTLKTYQNVTAPGSPTFHDDQYCNPDWSGCAVWTADVPATAAIPNYFAGGRFNGNCDGAANLFYLWATTRGYGSYGECGRGVGISPSNKLSLIAGFQAASNNTFTKSIDGRNTTIIAHSPITSASSLIRMPGNAFLTLSMHAGQNRLVFDGTNPVLRNTALALEKFVKTNGPNLALDVTIDGITIPVKGLASLGKSPSRLF